MTNHKYRVAIFTQLHDLNMNFGYQRASGVIHLQAATLGFFTDLLRDSVRTVNNNRSFWNFFNLINKYCALLAQLIHHVFVMNNFMANVNGGTKTTQCLIHDIDSTVNACTKPARLRQQNFRGVV